MSSAARVVAVSEGLESFVRDERIAVGKVQLIAPLLPRPADEASGSPSAELGQFIEEHTPVILGVGSMVPDHDYATVLVAVRDLAGRFPRIGLVLANAGAKNDPEHRARIEALAQSMPYRVRIEEQLPHDQVLALMGASSVLVRGVRSESYGLSRVEAIQLGTPVVATPVGETAFMVLYDFGDPTSMTSAILTALDRPPETLRQAAAHFDAVAEANLSAVIDAYQACSS